MAGDRNPREAARWVLFGHWHKHPTPDERDLCICGAVVDDHLAHLVERLDSAGLLSKT